MTATDGRLGSTAGMQKMSRWIIQYFERSRSPAVLSTCVVPDSSASTPAVVVKAVAFLVVIFLLVNLQKSSKRGTPTTQGVCCPCPCQAPTAAAVALMKMLQHAIPSYMLGMVLLVMNVLYATSEAPSSLVSPQLLPAPVQLVADYFDDDPTARCSADAVSVAVDALLVARQAASPATIVASLSLAPSQLLEAVVFTAAGLTVTLFQTCGTVLFTTSSITSPPVIPCATHDPGLFCVCRLGGCVLLYWVDTICNKQWSAGPLGRGFGNERPTVPFVLEFGMPLPITGATAILGSFELGVHVERGGHHGVITHC